MSNRTCSVCQGTAFMGVEYQGTAEDYDGMSELVCKGCGARWGRWTGKRLAEGELEPRWGLSKTAKGAA